MKYKLALSSLMLALMIPTTYAHEQRTVTNNGHTTTLNSTSATTTHLSMNNTALSEAQKTELLKPYPAPQKNMTRHVIFLPQLNDENSVKVELAIGKNLDVDCNRQRLIGKVTQKTIEGWGYSYLEVSDVKGPLSTLMACPNNTKTNQFVTLHSAENQLYRYNSKLPIVIYTPTDITVKYRLWHADNNWQNANQ